MSDSHSFYRPNLFFCHVDISGFLVKCISLGILAGEPYNAIAKEVKYPKKSLMVLEIPMPIRLLGAPTMD